MRVGHLLKQIIMYLVRKKWFLFGFLPGALVLGVFVALLAGHFLMTYPGICLHCHVPQTRVMMWAESVHPSEVTCVNCHAKHGQLFPHKFSAEDEFVNNNCVYCHKGVEIKEEQISDDIRIAHRLHIQELELRCVDCIATSSTKRPFQEQADPLTKPASSATRKSQMTTPASFAIFRSVLAIFKDAISSYCSSH